MTIEEIKPGDIIKAGRYDYKVVRIDKIGDTTIIKATKPKGKRMFAIKQFPSGNLSNAIQL